MLTVIKNDWKLILYFKVEVSEMYLSEMGLAHSNGFSSWWSSLSVNGSLRES